MASIGASLDSAIAGLQRNVNQAIKTAGQLSRDGEELTAAAEAEPAAESGSDGGVGGIDVTV